MARSAFIVFGAALLAVLLLAAASVSADTITVNSATSAWLSAWIAAIPNLQAIWLNPDICSRSGIQCDATTKTLSIRLDAVTTSGFNLIGTLPEVSNSINGAALQVSAISVKGKTRFTGTVPASWSAITKLTSLDVSQTKMSGLIPDSLGALPNLVSVDFSNSFFCYGMPNWNATTMTSLTTALFTNNNMRGTFASSWSTFSTALSLDITGNNLCGCIPSTWTNSNLISAANAMDSTSVSGCAKTCDVASLTYCPAPSTTSGTSSQLATVTAVVASIAVAAVSLMM